MASVALRPGRRVSRELPSKELVVGLTGYVASTKGICAGGTLGGGGGGSELLSLDEDLVDEAFIEHGSEAGRAKEDERNDCREAHFDE